MFMAQTLDDNHGQLPLARLFSNPSSADILDFLLSNYGLKYSDGEISKINNVPIDSTKNILQTLLEEKIIKSEKDALDTVYYANFSSERTNGLFSYIRATLDENLNAHESAK